MKLEMKAIKHSHFASQETYCYEGVVYIDGKKSLYVSNDGHGGSDRQHTVGDILIEKLDDWCKKNLPKWEVSFDGSDAEEQDTDFEMWCHNQVTNFLIRKELKNKLTKCVIFFKNGDLMESRYRVKKLSGVHMNHFKINHKNVKVILNEMPFDDAFKIYNEFLERTA